MNEREYVLNQARVCVCGDREQDYGSPENNFHTIANLWMDYLGAKGVEVDLELYDVAAMLALLKIARIAGGHAKKTTGLTLPGMQPAAGNCRTPTLS